jgi:hypothetical protein
MWPDLVRPVIRYAVETAGVIMGDMEMIKLSTGEKTVYKADGTVIREANPITIEWCDRCEMWKPLELGRYISHLGELLIWECGECK